MGRPSRRRKGSQQTSSPSSSSSAAAAALDSEPASSPEASSPGPVELRTPSEPIERINARPHLERAGNGSLKPTIASFYSALAQCTFPAWASTATMIILIFGGCCSNVCALVHRALTAFPPHSQLPEVNAYCHPRSSRWRQSSSSSPSPRALLSSPFDHRTLTATARAAPASGHLITFCQFLLVAFEGLLYHFEPTSKTLLKSNTIPIHRWLVQIALFFSVSLLNNHAFDYNISVPVHIILRSGGSMTTMVIGYLWGKRYSRVQVASVVLLTVGCVLAALGDSKGMGESESSTSRFLSGLAILFIAQLLSAIMGLYIEATYSKYGNNYREGLFYTHAISLVLFIPLFPQLRGQFAMLSKSSPLPPQPYLPTFLSGVPRQIVFLGLNAVTQYVCIRGVNMLGAMASALTVTVVLNVRKLVSLLLSIWLFGNQLSPGVMVGAAVVFVGGFAYGVEGQRQSKRRKRELKRQ